MPLKLVKAESAQNQSETETAWHIFCALSQYHAANPVVSDLPDFGKAVLAAHEKWAGLFGK